MVAWAGLCEEVRTEQGFDGREDVSQANGLARAKMLRREPG